MSAKKQKNIRVRFAPSPTGNLHIGSARTALFNWLYAKANKGKYIVRIEDTDYQRSMEEYIHNIVDGLKWLGLDWDEGPGEKGKFGPYRQSERIETYNKYAKQIVEKGHAYKCYCTDEELEAKRRNALSSGKAPKYDGTCRNLTNEQMEKLESDGRKFVYRFKMPGDTIYIDDLIRGKVKFDCSLIGDFVIIKSNGTPSYNFAAVIDDHLMEISHVIRGEDHLSNTPRQIMIYKALGFEPPEFAHLPIIMGTDRSKLSKRHGALAVLDYKKDGYLSEAVSNFLALLGWSPKNDQEIMSQKELIKNFSLEGVSKSGSVFDVVKLKWMNGQYIKNIKSKELVKMVKPYLLEAGYKIDKVSDDWLIELIDTVRDGINVLSDIKPCSRLFFEDGFNYDDIKEVLYHKHASLILDCFDAKFSALGKLEHNNVNSLLDDVVKETGQKKSAVFKTIRTVLTGSSSGPELWRIIRLYGKEKTLDRIKKAKEMRKV